MLTGLKMLTLACKCVFYRPEQNAKVALQWIYSINKSLGFLVVILVFLHTKWHIFVTYSAKLFSLSQSKPPIEFH